MYTHALVHQCNKYSTCGRYSNVVLRRTEKHFEGYHETNTSINIIGNKKKGITTIACVQRVVHPSDMRENVLIWFVIKK